MTKEAEEYINSENFIEGHECLKHGVPWITLESIYKLDEVLTKDDVVLEIGTGGSTIFFSEKCQSVTAIETSPKWAAQVEAKLSSDEGSNVLYVQIEDEDDICQMIKNIYTGDITVFSVDTQGGYNRSRILDAFLEKEDSCLRMVILDNYSHEGLFPLHYNKKAIDWEVFDYNHPRWAGDGTRIYLKK